MSEVRNKGGFAVSKYKAVIVDDEMFAREFLNQCINDLCTDFEVCAMLNDGSNAIEYLKENKADVILSDVRMPGISGIELAKYINDNNMNIPIVLVSAYDDFKYAQEAMRYGVKYYLLKVIDTNEYAYHQDYLSYYLIINQTF